MKKIIAIVATTVMALTVFATPASALTYGLPDYCSSVSEPSGNEYAFKGFENSGYGGHKDVECGKGNGLQSNQWNALNDQKLGTNDGYGTISGLGDKISSFQVWNKRSTGICLYLSRDAWNPASGPAKTYWIPGTAEYNNAYYVKLQNWYVGSTLNDKFSSVWADGSSTKAYCDAADDYPNADNSYSITYYNLGGGCENCV